MDNQQIWQAVLGELELTLSKANFTTWFKSTSIISNQNGEVIVGVPNGFTKEWLENKYQKDISRAIQNISGCRIKKLVFCLNNTKDSVLRQQSIQAQTIQPRLKEEIQIIQQETLTNNINPRYTFDNFIIGPNNELARAAAMAVAKSPGKTYNPLFIYGGVGLGKTHLVQAIGNVVLMSNPKKKVVYVSCERFIEDFIDFIQKGKGKMGVSTFKNKYRTADYLLIDDIQFLAGKEGTQEEFFHTFNTLYQNNKQIVLTSDRPPKAISSLEDRLVSRFEGGMIADISMPNLETRKAILARKCQERGYTIPENVLNYVSANIQNNIRELEGALSRIVARCQLNGIKPTEELARNILANIITNPNKKAITAKGILDTVANFYGIKLENLIAKNRKKEIAWPRQVAMYLMRDEIKTSFPSIGEEIGGRDHTTAIHAYEKVSKEIEKDHSLRQEIDIIRQKLYLTTVN